MTSLPKESPGAAVVPGGNGRRSLRVFWPDETLAAVAQNVNPNSRPSDLKITDLRVG